MRFYAWALQKDRNYLQNFIYLNNIFVPFIKKKFLEHFNKEQKKKKIVQTKQKNHNKKIKPSSHFIFIDDFFLSQTPQKHYGFKGHVTKLSLCVFQGFIGQKVVFSEQYRYRYYFFLSFKWFIPIFMHEALISVGTLQKIVKELVSKNDPVKYCPIFIYYTLLFV